jgi:hypothetical protein
MKPFARSRRTSPCWRIAISRSSASPPSIHSAWRRSPTCSLWTRCGHFAFAFTRNRERPSAIRRAWARALTATTVRPRSAAMSKTEALEMTNSRSRSSSSVVQAFALFSFFPSVSPGSCSFPGSRRRRLEFRFTEQTDPSHIKLKVFFLWNTRVRSTFFSHVPPISIVKTKGSGVAVISPSPAQPRALAAQP